MTLRGESFYSPRVGPVPPHTRPSKTSFASNHGCGPGRILQKRGLQKRPLDFSIIAGVWKNDPASIFLLIGHRCTMTRKRSDHTNPTLPCISRHGRGGKFGDVLAHAPGMRDETNPTSPCLTREVLHPPYRHLSASPWCAISGTRLWCTILVLALASSAPTRTPSTPWAPADPPNLG